MRHSVNVFFLLNYSIKIVDLLTTDDILHFFVLLILQSLRFAERKTQKASEVGADNIIKQTIPIKNLKSGTRLILPIFSCYQSSAYNIKNA